MFKSFSEKVVVFILVFVILFLGFTQIKITRKCPTDKMAEEWGSADSYWVCPPDVPMMFSDTASGKVVEEVCYFK